MTPESPRRVWLRYIAVAMIAAAALGLRLWMLQSYLPLSPWVGGLTLTDAEMGRNLLAGRGWVGNRQMLEKATAANLARNEMVDLEDLLPVNDGQPGSVATVGAAHSPGYSVWFAASYWLGGAARYRYSQRMQAVLDTLGCLLLFLIGRSLWSTSAGLMASGLYALWPAPAFLGNLTVAASTDSFWFIAVAYGAVTTWRQLQRGATPWGTAIVAAAAFGGACMNSTSFALPAAVGGVAALAAVLLNRRAWRMVACMVVAQMLVALMLTPWASRNQRLFGQFSPVRGSFWQLAWASFGELPNPWGLGYEDKYYWNWIGENCSSCNDGEQSRRARDFIINTVVLSRPFPRYVANLVAWRLPALLAVSHVPPGRYLESDAPLSRNALRRVLETADLAVPVLFVLAGIGVVIVWRRRDAREAMLVAMAPTLFLTTFSLLFIVELRKTVPGFGFLVVPAGVAVSAIAPVVAAGVRRLSSAVAVRLRRTTA